MCVNLRKFVSGLARKMDVYICHNSYTHAKKDAPEKLFVTRSGGKSTFDFSRNKGSKEFSNNPYRPLLEPCKNQRQELQNIIVTIGFCVEKSDS